MQRAADVAESVLEPQRAAALVPHGAVQAGQGADGRSVGAQVPQRPVLPGGRYGRHHDVRLDGAERFVTQAQAIHYARGEVFNHHVAFGDQAFRQFHSLGFTDVQGYAKFAPVDVVKHRVLFRIRLVAHDGAAHPHIVEALARFDLDDLGPHVGQRHAGDGAGQHPAEVQHTIAGQRAVVGISVAV